MKTLSVKIIQGSLPTSPVLVDQSIPLPEAIPDFSFSYELRKRVLWVNIVYTVSVTIG